MNTLNSIPKLPAEITKDIQFNDIFNLEEIQRMQDLFSDATGVSSMITSPDGTPITQPSNFCRLCQLVRETEKGMANCIKSDASNCSNLSTEKQLKPCLSVGLIDIGVRITVHGIHLANWLIGQVRNEETNVQKMLDYGDEIGVNKDEFLKAI